MFAETIVKPPHFAVPGAMYGLQNVAAGFFYVGITLGVIGAMGLARAAVEEPTRVFDGDRTPRTIPALLVMAALLCVGLAIVCYVASPIHTILPF